MKAVVQRVSGASVTVGGRVIGSIDFGLLVYLGVAVGDTEADVDWLADKIIKLRIFDDAEGKMNLSLGDASVQSKAAAYINTISVSVTNNGTAISAVHSAVGILAISQFTLLGDVKKGRRPSWNNAAPPESARKLYHAFTAKIREKGFPCQCGEFQSLMKVNYTNEGPVTILIDSGEIRK